MHGTGTPQRSGKPRPGGVSPLPASRGGHIAIRERGHRPVRTLTGEQNLRFHADLYGVPRQRMRQVLDMAGLWDMRQAEVATCSGGMKRRLEIARGLLHAPRVLFLDEPTVGLDPQTRASIWEYVNDLKRREDITIS